MLETLLFCTVVGITDGDTLRAHCATVNGPRTLAIRLVDIDAPERGQPFGQRSRQQLAALCLRAAAELRPAAVDRYGRTVAQVTCRGADAGTEQVRAGLAWTARRGRDARPLRRLQAEARRDRRGLWSETAPVPPWTWRQREREREGRADQGPAPRPD
jgi:endonuclease YncB( thermonuclease family)